ncbi:threonine synthase [Paenibacillaceae bacterium WGS1546]|uniref:threonine synthase n=1 Tax=Cohnella sp. WGS1546 TaxID=3366810 RepID=UPI00372CF4E7
MFATRLRCVSCEKVYPLEALYECSECGGILQVDYDFEKLAERYPSPEAFDDFAALLPVRPEHVRTLGEGNTPLIRTDRLARRLGLRELWLKNEAANPTGSFKDRPISVGIAKALEFGVGKIVIASSGNGAAAAAAYAAKAGLAARVLVPESTPDEKVSQARFYGADVERIPGPYSNCYAAAKKISEDEGCFNLTTTFLNPYTVEGDKLVGVEIYKQLGNAVPDVVFAPIGDGPILVGTHRGFRELRLMFPSLAVPRMAGIQAEGCSPIARAFAAGEQTVVADEAPSTIAGGICDGLNGYAKDGTWTLRHIRESSGFSLAVSDERIAEAQAWLAKDEGVFVEPSAAACIAGVAAAVREGKVGASDRIVAVLTGHGLKDMNQVRKYLAERE